MKQYDGYNAFVYEIPDTGWLGRGIAPNGATLSGTLRDTPEAAQKDAEFLAEYLRGREPQ